MHEIVDATPLPNWAYVVQDDAWPRLFAATLGAASSPAIVQLFNGYTNFELGKYFSWYVLPLGFDMVCSRSSPCSSSRSARQICRLGIMVSTSSPDRAELDG
jgi:hypothetical protein